MIPGKYEFIPAGMFYPNHGGMGIYVRYRGGDNRVVLKSHSPWHFHVQCPDRELYMVWDTNYAYGNHPTDGSWDRFVVLSPFHERQAQDWGIPTFMLNYFQVMTKGSQNHATRRNGKRGKINLVCDSGGFQILTGVVEYLDPVQIVEWYNENVDIGLVLDIPGHVNCHDTYLRAAEVQRKNTELMLKHKAPHLELMNIFHGAFAEDKAAYREVCEHPDINRLALGSAYFGSIMNSIDDIFSVVTTGRKYDQYHVLGVSNVLQVILLMRMAAKGFAPLITSDSSSHIAEGTVKRYRLYPHIGAHGRSFDIGDNTNYPNPKNTLPCNCPVCENIKYMDVLAALDSNVVNMMLMYHNIFAVQKYYQAMAEITREASTTELKQLTRLQMSRARSGRQEMMRGLDYIDHICDHGVDKARQNYHFYLSKGLFGGGPMSGFQKEGQPKKTVVDGNLKHMQRIIGLYEGDRSGLVHGQKPPKRRLVKNLAAYAKARVPPGMDQKRKGSSKHAAGNV